MSVITGLWRWRHNPLRRATDLVEAWGTLLAALLLAIAAPAAGAVGGAVVDSSLRGTMRAQYEQRHLTTAVVTGRPPGSHRKAYDPESARPHDLGSRVSAIWQAPDGSRRTGTLHAPGRDPRAGTTFRAWTDANGEPVAAPMNPVTARIHAVLAGSLTAALAAALVLCGRRLFVRRLILARHRRLDQAWAKTGPDWGRTGADS
jgi:hypothetical protein